MKCGYCGHEFAQDEGIKACGRCGKPGGCRMIRCPRCFYENQPEPALVQSIKKLFGTKDKGAKE